MSQSSAMDVKVTARVLSNSNAAGSDCRNALGAGDPVDQHAFAARRVVLQAMQELDPRRETAAGKIVVGIEPVGRVGQVLRIRL